MLQQSKNTLLILASSRSNGNTAALSNNISKHLNVNVLDLLNYNFSEFDYEHKNKEDDFLTLIEEIISNYDHILFASPIYWYAVSAKMKIFIDRLSDLLIIQKDLGRKLRGKKVGVITSSIGNNLAENFWYPLDATFSYLGMKVLYKKHFYEDLIDLEDLDELKEVFT